MNKLTEQMVGLSICRITTIPFALVHNLGGQIRASLSAGYNVHVVTSPGGAEVLSEELPGADYHPVEIRRTISPFADVQALIALYCLFRQHHFDVVHSSTPKAGLLCAVAGFLARVPIRLHSFTGQPWVTLGGFKRWITMASDRLVARLNTQCYADSASQRDFLEAEGVARLEDVKVLGAGSLSGVDLEKFDPGRWAVQRASIRAELGIAPEATVCCYIGRVARDKGVIELVDAFLALVREGYDVHLLMVGPPEPKRDPQLDAVLKSLNVEPRIHMLGYSTEPERYLAITAIFCLPSYREGFGNVVIEAAAMGVPTMGTRIPGLVDAVVDEQTGVLVPVQDVNALQRGLARLLDDVDLRRRLGEAARARVVRDFDERQVTQLVLEEYQRLAALHLPGRC